MALTPAKVLWLWTCRVNRNKMQALGSAWRMQIGANQGAKNRCNCCRSYALSLWLPWFPANMASFVESLTYLHMAAAPELADAMVNAKTTGVAL